MPMVIVEPGDPDLGASEVEGVPVEEVPGDRAGGVRRGRRDMYLHLYEHFLEAYEQRTAQAVGLVLHAREVVEHMVRLAERRRWSPGSTSRPGFRDEDVLTVIPAMGTGTYLHTILKHVAEQVAAQGGRGVVPGVLQQVARRMVGFELQMGSVNASAARPPGPTSDWLFAPSGAALQVCGVRCQSHAGRGRACLGSLGARRLSSRGYSGRSPVPGRAA